MKIRKVKRGKSYRYNVNRKRMSRRQTSTGNIKCREIKEHWSDKKSIKTNLKEMGLALDSNLAVGIPNTKKERLKIVKMVNGFVEEEAETVAKPKRGPRKGFVVQKLEEEANAPRESQFRLPKSVIAELSYFLDKYKFNYSRMVTDRRNHNQWTWRQFRGKIKKFMFIPEQFSEFLSSRNLSETDLKEWDEYDSD